ncbi:histidine phosphatase family protein [Paraburkholderia sp. Tr-20389]|uniref:histidine phosphatase family protein n=1 Tax=Paraburkholderia sp. Tr-20389 TaxID=2703903 RepID=UPI00197D3C67|nr:histidine phosphatase family protein [Paraburkholderia sp. Tr-20389]MBN3754407.1 histidine phosphatase family protein [Paraburkholderia sp. Tr-20389]
MAELYLVRHGQASFGADDYDRLSDVGEQQGVWLGEYFAQRDIRFDRVMTGTLRRHAQTLAAIWRGLDAPPVECEIHPGLDEYDFHALFRALGDEHAALAERARRSPRDFFKALREVLQLWAEGVLDGRAPETWQAFQQRVADARTAIQRGDGQRVLVVSSGGVIAAITQQILQAPAATAIALNMQIRNSSVSHYFFNRDTLHLSSFNGIGHLDDPQRRAFQTYG